MVRYFGGVKLGVGGLISAYRTAAENVLSNSKVVEREITNRISLHFDYSATPEVMRLVNEFSMTIVGQKFEERCEIQLQYNVRHEKEILEKVSLLVTMGKARL